uniref:WAP domain-containing protein n=1 Tax=Ditylenchus dipsaci TaxID=166011 RepID=A0A915EP05_9BILA
MGKAQDLSACPNGHERKGGCSIKHFCFRRSQECIKGDCCKKLNSKESANGQNTNGMNFGLNYARNFGMGGNGFGMPLPCYDFQPNAYCLVTTVCYNRSLKHA